MLGYWFSIQSAVENIKSLDDYDLLSTFDRISSIKVDECVVVDRFIFELSSQCNILLFVSKSFSRDASRNSWTQQQSSDKFSIVKPKTFIFFWHCYKPLYSELPKIGHMAVEFVVPRSINPIPDSIGSCRIQPSDKIRLVPVGFR
jgi:hypothetical protein